MSTRKIVIFISFVFLTKFGFSQTPQLQIEISKSKILVGDTLKLVLKAELDKNSYLIFPELYDTLADGVHVVGNPKVDSIIDGNSKIYTKQFFVSAYDSAQHYVSQLAAVYLHQGMRDTIYSGSVSFLSEYQNLTTELETKIDTSLTEKIIRNKSNIETPFTWKEFWLRLKTFLKEYWYFVLALIILLAFGFYWYFVIRKRKSDVGLKVEVKVKPHVEAINSLDALANKKLWQQGKTKDYYSELSDILRNYIEKRFNIIALESTTDIIKKQFQHYKLITKEQEQDIYTLLQLADYVKFAKYQAMPAENAKAIERGYNFVLQTKPEEIQPTEVQTENTKKK